MRQPTSLPNWNHEDSTCYEAKTLVRDCHTPCHHWQQQFSGTMAAGSDLQLRTAQCRLNADMFRRWSWHLCLRGLENPTPAIHSSSCVCVVLKTQHLGTYFINTPMIDRKKKKRNEDNVNLFLQSVDFVSVQKSKLHMTSTPDSIWLTETKLVRFHTCAEIHIIFKNIANLYFNMGTKQLRQEDYNGCDSIS